MNPQAHHIVEAEKARKLAQAISLTKTAKLAKTSKKVILLSLMQNYGYSVHDARAIYKAAK